MAADAVIGFRVPHETRAAIDTYCEAHGISITDLYRSLTEALLNGQISAGSIEGYKAGRSIAIQLAGILLAQASAALPETLEEAQARYSLVG